MSSNIFNQSLAKYYFAAKSPLNAQQAKSILLKGVKPNYQTVRSFLTPFGCDITEDEYNKLLEIKPVRYCLPLSREQARDVLGLRVTTSHEKSEQNRKAGVYVFTHTGTGRKYVGGSVNLAHRVRTYFGKSHNTRVINKAILHHGLSAFTLDIYPITLSNFNSFKPVSLVFALEQHYIFTFNPVFNVNKLAAGQHTTAGVILSSQMSTSVNSKPLYVYNSDKTALIHTASSRVELSKIPGMSIPTLNRYADSDKPLYGKFIITRTLLENVDSYPMEVSEFSELLLEGKANQRKQVFESNRQRKTPITLTDLMHPDQPSYNFDTMQSAISFSETYGDHRRLYKQAMTKSGEFKGWRFIKGFNPNAHNPSYKSP